MRGVGRQLQRFTWPDNSFWTLTAIQPALVSPQLQVKQEVLLIAVSLVCLWSLACAFLLSRQRHCARNLSDFGGRTRSMARRGGCSRGKVRSLPLPAAYCLNA